MINIPFNGRSNHETCKFLELGTYIGSFRHLAQLKYVMSD